jgi:2-dehydropantoate 2-reductase
MKYKGIKIGVVGLGALGTMYAQCFMDGGFEVSILVDADRKVRYGSTDIQVNQRSYSFDFKTPKSGDKPFDLLLLAVKDRHLDDAIQLIRPVVGPQTMILSLLNGISSEQQLIGIFGESPVLYGFGVGMDALREGRKVDYTCKGHIVFGEGDNQQSERIVRLSHWFDAAEIPHRIPDNIQHAQWAKFMLNVGLNQVSALMRAPFGHIQQDPHLRKMLQMASDEALIIAQTKGITLSQEDIDQMWHIIDGINPMGRTSMLQDVLDEQPTEVDLFAGEVVRLGKAQGIPTPVNAFLLEALRSKEKPKVQLI